MINPLEYLSVSSVVETNRFYHEKVCLTCGSHLAPTPVLCRIAYESRTDRRLLGSTGLGFETPTRASTGYVLARDAWGQGYATEALGAIIESASNLGIGRKDRCSFGMIGADFRDFGGCFFYPISPVV
jgi:hypothetical protein